MFVKFTVKVFDMPTVTDHPVMSARKDAILGRRLPHAIGITLAFDFLMAMTLGRH